MESHRGRDSMKHLRSFKQKLALNFIWNKCLIFSVISIYIISANMNAQSIQENIPIEKITTLDGETYTNVTVTSISEDKIRFIYSDGIKSMPISKINSDAFSAKIFNCISEMAKQSRLANDKMARDNQIAKEKHYLAIGNLVLDEVRKLRSKGDYIRQKLLNKEFSDIELSNELEGMSPTDVKILLGPPDSGKDDFFSYEKYLLKNHISEKYGGFFIHFVDQKFRQITCR